MDSNKKQRSGEKLAPVKKQRRREKLRAVFAPRNVIIMVLFVFIAAGFIRDYRGLNIYQKLFMGKDQTVEYPNLDKEKNSQYKILIDPGHGGDEDGAVAVVGKKKEKDLNLEVSKRLKRQLEEAGFQVQMTREKDIDFGEDTNADLNARKEIIQSSGADLVISVHMNWIDDPSISGPIAFYMPGSIQGETFATDVQNRLNEILQPKTKRKAQAQNFYVLRSGNMPSILVECGFISNEEEAKKLRNKEYQEQVAQGITFGTLDYVNSLPAKQ